MESSGAVMIEGEDYEVVDECMEEEDCTSSAHNQSSEEAMDTSENKADDDENKTVDADTKKGSDTGENVKEDNPVASKNEKEDNSVTSDNVTKDNPVTSENVKEDNSVTSDNVKENNSATADNVKEDNSVASDNVKEDNSITSDNAKEDHSITSDNAKEDHPITSDNAKEDHSVTSDNAKEDHSITSATAKEDNAVASEIAKKDDAVASETAKKDDAVASETEKKDDAVASETANKDDAVASETAKKGHSITSETAKKDDAVASENVEEDDVVILENVSKSSEPENGKSIDGVPVAVLECPEEQNTETIDFTADINLDQLDDQKDMTDEDVLHHLDEIENIVLDPSTFRLNDDNDEGLQNNTEPKLLIKQEHVEQPVPTKNVSVNQEASCNSVKVSLKHLIEHNEKNDWYERKLAEKEATIKERLSKLARVLELSYPTYQKWLEYVEKISGSPVCKLLPPRRCRLDKPYTNRWKFVCSRKTVQESTKETGDAEASPNKNVETVWRLEATGSWGVNTNNESEFPPFVLRAVKIFEDFLQTTEQPPAQEVASLPVNFSDDVSIEIEMKREPAPEAKQQWLWLLVRCNSMDELMLFATGKNISRNTMDRLKQVYESGPGKDCNVKSLYCKSVNKCDDTTVTNTTFLVGSEALDETVGNIKVQLAPKTNFWSNAAGAENVAKAVSELLAPTTKTTVLEIGCSIGLIGLMMASKCQQVIGVDSPSEVEEAEITSELNNIKNAKFIMGTANEVTNKVTAAVKNRRTYAIINANTNIGREIEMMTCLRKITSLKRIAMVTTLTKQSVRAILELARPVDRSHGYPFIPILACVVDTLPVGPHFEAVILMERRLVHRFNEPWFLKPSFDNPKAVQANANQAKSEKQGSNLTDKGPQNKVPEAKSKKNMNKSAAKPPAAKKLKGMVKNSMLLRHPETLAGKGKFKGKRPHSPDKNEATPKKMQKKFEKFNAKAWRPDLTGKKKKDWNADSSQLRINPLYEKKLRENKEQADLRERLSSNRIDSDIAQKVKEHQVLLEIAKEKLSGPAPTVDVSTAKQLQSMLNMVLEQTNKLQNQLPRSVWDRIAPPEGGNHSNPKKDGQDEALLKGRYVQEMGTQDKILITTANEKFDDNDDPKPGYKKYNTLPPPVEPNLVMPVGYVGTNRENTFQRMPERYHGLDGRKQQNPGNSWGRDRPFEKNRWEDAGGMRKPASPVRKQEFPMKHRASPPRRFSPKRPLLSPPRRPYSPPRRHFSPLRRPMSPFRQRSPPGRRPVSPQGHATSPSRRQMPPMRRPLSPPNRPMSPPRRGPSPVNRPVSPMRREMSPLHRQFSPMRPPMSPSRRPISPMRRQMSPPRRQMPSPSRAMPEGGDIMPPRRQTGPQEREYMSSMRRGGSPQRFALGRPASPPRRQQSPPRRQMSPRRYNDEWDIPSRSAVEHTTWTRPLERMPDSGWQSEKRSSNPNWEQPSSSDRYRKTMDQEKWGVTDTRENTWSSGGNSWKTTQLATKPMMKDTWPQNSESRWTGISNVGGSNDNWKSRAKENFAARDEPWMDSNKQSRWEPSNSKDPRNQGDKEDWNDLPEDARDPWGDDGNLGLKERWLKFDNPIASSTWTRENDQGDSWSKPKDNWQNKGQSLSTKSLWQNNGSQNTGESRWMSHNDIGKKGPSGTWQSGNNGGSWQPQNFNLNSQRSFSSNQFKDLR